MRGTKGMLGQEFEFRLCYVVRPCFKKKTTKPLNSKQANKTNRNNGAESVLV